MQLDSTTCSRARLARDPRFDGRFFVAVATTGVYCRPICPVRPPKEKNVRYYPSAAAAAEAGFRPCLRCRPECSPGTPAWLGTSSTVSRALRLIGESALEDGSMDSLAARVGIGSRHLRRLFLQHLGATPIAIEQTRRLHFAKKLIDETSLPMNEVALASGFGSVRRFNATFQKTYGRAPTHIRNLARRAPLDAENEYRFLLRFRPPFDWKGLLEFLTPRAIPGVEMIEHEIYRRSFQLHNQAGWLQASFDGHAAVALRIHFPDPRSLFLIVERARRLFDLTADPAEINPHLRRDFLLSASIAACPGMRLPGSWDGFELAIRAILGQQVTVRGASTLAGRLVREFGTPLATNHGLTHMFPSAARLADADVARIGLPRARANTIRALARAVTAGDIRFDGVANVDEWKQCFCAIPGIGDWTAQYVAMRALGEPDAFPAADLGLLHATGLRSPRELEARSQAWRPWRAYAAMHLWQSTVDGRTGVSAHPAPKGRHTLARHVSAGAQSSKIQSPLQRTAP